MLATGNLFITAYVQSDWFGKGIFWGLFILSVLCWSILIHKIWIFLQMRRLSTEFYALFSDKDPLNLPFQGMGKGRILEIPHPFFEIYKSLKQKTLQIIGRNHLYAVEGPVFLCEADISLIEAQVFTTLAKQAKVIDKNLFVLSTIAALGPFLGLLGTVWGILLTFSQLNMRGFSSSNGLMLAALSMALATTVIGLVVAIPALVGYNYLKNAGREYRHEMEDFSQLLLSAVELQYRKPEHAQKIPLST